MTDAVTQAREAVMSAVNNIGWATQADSLDLVPDLLDAYAAALLAAERQRVVGIVEGMKMSEGALNGGVSQMYRTGHNAALSQLAARLTGGE
jgi:hypothetical protein